MEKATKFLTPTRNSGQVSRSFNGTEVADSFKLFGEFTEIEKGAEL